MLRIFVLVLPPPKIVLYSCGAAQACKPLWVIAADNFSVDKFTKTEMKSIDQLYQTAVDKEAERVLNLSVDSVLKVDDYGTVEATISGNKIIIGYWHHKLSDKLHRIIFQADRKVFLFLKKNI